MFGIGGGELIFILFIILMLFGSDKIPEIARTMGKVMAQLRNATNDLKSEIKKGAEENGFDQKMLNGLTGSVTSEADKIKNDLSGNNFSLKGISDNITSEIDKTGKSLLSEDVNFKTTDNSSKVFKKEGVPNGNQSSISASAAEEMEEMDGPIKRKK